MDQAIPKHAAAAAMTMPGGLVPFLNLGHALTHLIMLIFPTAVLALGPAWGISYGALMPASLGGLIAYGAGSLPSGWLGDRWSRRSMMVVFFLGIGIGSILCGLARTPLEIGIALGVVGLFASIYHPVGLSLLVVDPARLGRTLGLNGVFGNLGIAGAAMVTGLISDALGWRWAFIAPGLLSALAGIAFLILIPALPKAGAKALGTAQSSGVQSFTLIVAAALLLFIICDSLVFNATTMAMPKVAETELAGWLQGPGAVGTIVSIVFAIAALAQLWIGHLIDRMPLGRIFLPLAAAQIIALLLAGSAHGPWFIAPALATMFIVFGLIPIGDALIARAVSDAWRSRAYAISYVVAFGIGPAAVPLIAALYDGARGFPYLFSVLAAIAGGTLLAAVAMRKQLDGPT
jgi:MFS family permease